MTISARSDALIALTRAVPPTLATGELTHLERQPIDVEVAVRQHAAYEAALRDLGCDVRRIPPAPEHPDSVFVEDTAVVVDELAVIARPGALSRRGETAAVREVLAAFLPLLALEAPATLDGGDVLRLGRRILVGLSARTSASGAADLSACLAPHGYAVEAVPFTGCLHLKTAVTEAAPDTVVLNPQWVDPALFPALRCIEVDPAEPFGANVLRIGDTTLVAASAPRTAERLRKAGVRVRLLDVSETQKAEGGLTCGCLLLRTSAVTQADGRAGETSV